MINLRPKHASLTIRAVVYFSPRLAIRRVAAHTTSYCYSGKCHPRRLVRSTARSGTSLPSSPWVPNCFVFRCCSPRQHLHCKLSKPRGHDSQTPEQTYHYLARSRLQSEWRPELRLVRYGNPTSHVLPSHALGAASTSVPLAGWLRLSETPG